MILLKNHMVNLAASGQQQNAATGGWAISPILIIGLLFAALIVMFWFVMRFRNSARRNRNKMKRFDMLTGLPNWEEMQAKIEKTSTGVLAIFEIKFFKAYNELMGYEVGDKVLKGIAQRLVAAQQTYGLFAARMQSASFAVLLPAMPHQQVQQTLYQMLEQIGRQDSESHEEKWSIRFACGAAEIQPSITADEALKNANFARLAAKDSLVTEVVLFDGDTHRQFTQFITSSGKLRQGIGSGDLVVAYQPKYALSNGKLVGAEALIRWQHPQRGLLLPAEFLPVLEQTGGIKRVDLYVLRQVLWQIKEWHKQGIPLLQVAVNISHTQFADANLAGSLLEVAQEYGVPAGFIQLDLTESAFIHDEDHVLNVMQSLHNAGFTLALDDFGAGLSSLNYLRKMPVDILNLDRSLLADIETDEKQQLFVKDIVRMVHDMGVATLLKGVETPAQANFAHEAQCNFVQGFLFGKPMPAEEYIALLLQNRQPAQ